MSKKALNNSGNSRNNQYQIISFEEQIQNDKERIKRRFNFTNSNNNSLNSSNISDIKSQLSIYSIKKNINNKNEKIILETNKSELSKIKDIMEESIVNNELIKNRNNKNSNNNVNNNNNINNNIDDDYYNIENSERIEKFDIIQKNNKSHNHIINESNINNNKIMKRNGSSPFLKTNNKFKKLLIDNRSNVSDLGLLDDEDVISKNHQDQVSKFKFISEVQKNNLRYENLSIKKFLALNNKCIFNIFSFLYDNYKMIMISGKQLKNLFNLTLKGKFSYIIDNFKSKYKDILQFESFKFIQNETVMLNKKKIPIFSVFLKCQIKETPYLLKYEEISYEISYSFNILKVEKKIVYIIKYINLI